MKIPKIIAKIMLCRSCYSILVLYEFKLLSKYPTTHHFTYDFFALLLQPYIFIQKSFSSTSNVNDFVYNL